MNNQVLNTTDCLARAVLNADADDLTGMANIHSLLDELRASLPEQEAGTEVGRQLGEKIGSARRLAEKVILREADDLAGAFKSITAAVSEIQALVDPATRSAAMAAVIPSGTTECSSKSVSPAAATEPVDTILREDDLPLVHEFIAEATSHLESAEAELLKLEVNPDDGDAISSVFRSFHTIKGVAGFLNLAQIGSLAHAAENLLDLGRKGQLIINEERLELVLAASDVMRRLVGLLGQAANTGAPLQKDAAVGPLIQRLHAVVSGDKHAAISAAPAPVASVSTKHIAPEITPTKPAGPAVPTPAASSTAPTTTPKGSTAEATVKVATDRLDNLINVVGELVIAHAMTSQDMARVTTTDQRLLRNMTHLGKITRELQDLSMSMRMVPVQGVFQKMTRLVRDLARKAGKEIELVLTGAETELDRNVVEAISDPLVHMVRNAADHGVESPDVRLAAGKAHAGRIELKAYHQAGNIVIEINDDGKGLNKDRILKKAKDAGIVREGQDFSEQEIFRLIFHAGLSTAEKITDVSGRGVGMDVVRKNVEALRGRIDITSVEGKGSTFTIRLPLTLAVIDGLIVKVGNDKFILPITSIEQSLRPKPEQLSTLQSRGEMCMVRGQLLPLIRLHRLFGIPPRNEDPTKSLVVIVQDNERRCCLLVDELLGQQQVVIKSLGKILGQVPGTSGGAIMGDGCVSLILDVPGIIELVGSD